MVHKLKGIISKEKGSITLEAALIMPIFLIFIAFLAMMIRIGVAEIALDQSAARTAQYIAAHVYPLDVIKGRINDKIKGNKKIEKVAEIAGKAYDIFGGEEVVSNLSIQALTPIVQDLFHETTGSLFQKENVEITELNLPSLLGGSGEYLGITLAYRLKLIFPFFDREIVLKKRAYERIWIGS